mgnify:CR=1 FL=1
MVPLSTAKDTAALRKSQVQDFLPSLTAAYVDPSVVPRIIAAYKANSPASVQLQQFLSPQTAKGLHLAIAKVSWRSECIPDRYSREIAALPAPAIAILREAGAFAFIARVTGLRLACASLERYGHRDYTLRNDEEEPPGLVAYLDWTTGWEDGWGGETIVADESGELARVGPMANTLVLIDCAAVYPFVRYVNHYAGKQVILRIVFS